MTPTTTRRALAAASLAGGLVVAAYLLFGVGYSGVEQGAVSATPGGPSITTGPETVHVSGISLALREHEWALVLWAGFVLTVSVMAAVSAWKGRAGPIWGAAGVMMILAVLALLSIGPVVALQAALLAVTATVVGRQHRPHGRPQSG